LVKISKLEGIILVLGAVFLAFLAGWALRGTTAARPVQVETERVLAASRHEPLSLNAPSESGGKVNINTADAEELQTLPGIGEKRAEDIVAYREANGPFRIVEELTNVKGIGESVLEGLIDYVSVE